MSWDFVAASSQRFDLAWSTTGEPYWMSCWMATDTVAAGDAAAVSVSDASAAFTDYQSIGRNAANGRVISQPGGAAFNTGGTVSVGKWHHICANFIGTASRAGYLDLTNSATNTTSSAVTWANVDALTIGGVRSLGIVISYFDGKIAEVLIGRGTLSHAEIAELSAGFGYGTMPRINSRADVLGYWPLVDDYNDHSGYGQHLTPVNGPTPSSSHPPVVRRTAVRFPTKVPYKHDYSIQIKGRYRRRHVELA